MPLPSAPTKPGSIVKDIPAQLEIKQENQKEKRTVKAKSTVEPVTAQTAEVMTEAAQSTEKKVVARAAKKLSRLLLFHLCLKTLTSQN